MSVHRFENERGALIFVGYDSADDVMELIRPFVTSPARWKQIPEGYGEWTGRWVTIHWANPTPWTSLPQFKGGPPPVDAGIPDYDVFLALFGTPPRGQTLRDRGQRQQWFDKLLDWGGLAPKISQDVKEDFETFELGTPIAWLNKRAGMDHEGEVYIHIPAVDRSIPLPQRNATGHVIAVLQYEAFQEGQKFTNIHPFAKRLVG